MKRHPLLYIYLALFSLLPVSVKAQKDVVNLSGKISDYQADRDTVPFEIWVYSSIKDEPRIIAMQINGDGTFSKTLSINHKQDVVFGYGDNIKLLVSPGDSITTEFEQTALLKTIKFAKGPAINRELVDYQNAFSAYCEKRYPGKNGRYQQFFQTKKRTPEKFKQFIFDRLKQETDFYNDFTAKNHSSELFKKWAKFELEYECANDLIQYTSGANIGAANKPLPKTYFDFFDRFALDNPEAAFSSAYLDFLSSYSNIYFLEKYKANMPMSVIAGFLISSGKNLTGKQILRLGKVQKKGPDKTSIFDVLFIKNILEANDGVNEDAIATQIGDYSFDALIGLFVNHTQGFARDVLLSGFICQMIDDVKDIDLIKSRLDTFLPSIGTGYLRDELLAELQTADEKRKNYQLSAGSKINFLPVTPSDSVFNKLIEPYRGKVILVDFWGTWCQPCLAAVPDANALYKAYSNKGVTILYLAVKSKENIWKSVIAEHKILGEHFLLSPSQEAVLTEKFRISGYPQYMLIDKRGFVKDENAKHPNDNALKREIDELLLN
ncbi:TlpA family protein disulfide reductase [Mucilaginibacter auburnensis]|uniref:Thiol-disulfide isomerase/thioredoxin n=1 Tax=Mucilaginibacter auburnensis TaxID=1457233 RepID=A0A2H9VQT1_9SPHI|nr:TlpA disulfide reductase family protein [Mucilaginibacter auburnensis]PJJ83143.1 thiol-disulfide isomerase/thioredoxin [Mucilaginibacter auburnensis]